MAYIFFWKWGKDPYLVRWWSWLFTFWLFGNVSVLACRGARRELTMFWESPSLEKIAASSGSALRMWTFGWDEGKASRTPLATELQILFFSEHCRLEISSIFHQEHLISCESWWDFPTDVIMTGSTGRVVTFVSNIPVRAGKGSLYKQGKFLSPRWNPSACHVCAAHATGC